MLLMGKLPSGTAQNTEINLIGERNNWQPFNSGIIAQDERGLEEGLRRVR